jgi:DNA-binding SARP family transcriptional activator
MEDRNARWTAVRQGGRTVTRFRTQKTAALLAYLAFHKEGPTPSRREALIERLWPDAPPGMSGATD